MMKYRDRNLLMVFLNDPYGIVGAQGEYPSTIISETNEVA
jgi:hypothetical protein